MGFCFSFTLAAILDAILYLIFISLSLLIQKLTKKIRKTTKKIQNHFNYVHSECLINKNYVNCEICGESINLDYVNKNIHYINKKDDCKTFRKVIHFLIILGFSFLLSYLFKMIIYVFIKPIRLYLKNNKYLYYNADIYNDPLNFIVHELIGILFFLFCFYPCCK